MCVPLLVVAAVSIAATAASSAASASAANKQAKATNKANAANDVSSANANDDTWEQDIQYGYKTLAYDQDAVDRQSVWAANAVNTTETNTRINMGQAILQSVQQNMADTLNVVTEQATGQGKRGSISAGADGRGVQGNSVDSIIQDVNQQENSDLGVMAINRSAQNQQARINVAAAKASGDSSLASIQSQYKIYEPATPIREASPEILTAEQQGPSALATGLTITANAATQAASTLRSYSAQTGTPAPQVVSSLAQKVGIK